MFFSFEDIDLTIKYININEVHNFMTEKHDYKKLGLISGIEIHAQLEGRKLFCDCPTTIRDDTPDFQVRRKLKAVVGETGKIDVAAQKEQNKNKDFIYQGYDNTTCLVELDEEPPHIMNKNALNLCIQMCKFLKCKFVDEIQVMRKIVVDGSNTSGFQRTSLVGFDGTIDVEGHEIDINSVCLEEDACKIVQRKAHEDIYNLSRLGIPLIEIATGPHMHTPKEVRKVAEKIGMYIKSLEPSQDQSVKRGLGTIRQDVNVSIKGGARIEIKGAQDLKMIETLIDNEVSRQVALLEIKKEFHTKNLVPSEINGVTSIFKDTSCKFIKKNIEEGGVVLGIKIPEFSGVLGKETMPGRRIGSEISDYGKMAGVGGLIHSDENLEKYQFSEKEIKNIEKILDIKKEDAFILVSDKESKARNAMEYILERISLFKKGVIKEVRKANPDGTSSFMRPMPGGSRMYPETDTLPLRPNTNVNIGQNLEEKAETYIKKGIKDKDIAMIIARNYATLFEELQNDLDVDAQFLASHIVSGSKVIEPSKEIYTPIFEAMSTGKIAKNSFLEVLEIIASGKDVKEAILSKQSMPREEVEKIVDKVISDISDADMSKMGLIMGKVMAASKGKADGKIASDIIRAKLK